MAEQKTITLLIDGNNLAHFLYQDLLPRQKMTEEISQRLMIHLDSYSRQQAGAVAVELYLDRLPNRDLEFFSSLRVFPAKFPQKADDVMIDRFWFHHITQQPCLVITNDEAILDEVRHAGGNTLLVFEFVRRRGITNPVLLDREDFPPLHIPRKDEKQIFTFQSLRASIYFRISQDRNHPPFEKPVHKVGQEYLPSTTRVEIPAYEISNLSPIPEISGKGEPISETENTQTVQPSGSFSVQPEPDHSIPSQYHYHLDLEKWPASDGIRFLKHAFCPAHRKEYRDLLSVIDYNAVTPADLRAVAELLLISCGDERDFTRRGSTMDRVRLALIYSAGLDLTLNEIAALTGLKLTGLQRKIKEKSGLWLSILS